MQQEFDFIVIGSGPAGQRAAVQAAKLGRQVAVVEQRNAVGGNCLHYGTIPSKTLREAVLYLSGFRQRGFYGRGYRVKDKVSAEDLMQRLDITVQHEVETLQHKLYRNHITTFGGRAHFADPHTVEFVDADGNNCRLSAGQILVATGTRPARPANIEFDGKHIVDSDQLLQMKHLPRTLAVIGAGVIGVEYATIFNALDVDVTLVDGRDAMLDFLDREIVDEFVHNLRDRNMTLRMGETVESITHVDDGKRVELELASGKRVRAEMALFAAGRQGNTDDLGLDAAGLSVDKRGRLKVNDDYQTEVPHIYAAGDVVGFPALASTSMEQGRHAACHAFGGTLTSRFEAFPFGIYSVPEMSVIGLTEEQAREQGLRYETGVARLRETSRGQILGLREGLLKLICEIDTRRILGIHIVGEGATELIHIGQAVLSHEGTLDFFIETVFNYPTLAETYKIAALDAWNRLNVAA